MIDDSRKIKREIKNWKKKRRIGLIIIDPFLNRCIYIYIKKLFRDATNNIDIFLNILEQKMLFIHASFRNAERVNRE